MIRRLGAAILLVFVTLLPAPAQAMPQTKPTAVATDDALESSPLYPDASSPTASKPGQITSSSGAFDFTRVALALGGVIALILILRFFAKRIVPGAAIHRASPAVKVLGKCPISPRQNLLVIQFGKRLVLVGDAGANLNPLCEITDPDEVAAILTQTREETISVARRFESLFGRARKDFADIPESETNDQFDDSRDVKRDDDAKQDDPAIAGTQKELSDLREKVRDVARQIGSA